MLFLSPARLPSLPLTTFLLCSSLPSLPLAYSFIFHPSAPFPVYSCLLILPHPPLFHGSCLRTAPSVLFFPPFSSPYLPLPPTLYTCVPPNLLITDPLLALSSPLPLILQAYVLEQRRGPSLCAYLCCPLSDGHVSVTCLISSATKMVTPLRSLFIFYSIFVCMFFFY